MLYCSIPNNGGGVVLFSLIILTNRQAKLYTSWIAYNIPQKSKKR